MEADQLTALREVNPVETERGERERERGQKVGEVVRHYI
jgi:hypothetical protein